MTHRPSARSRRRANQALLILVPMAVLTGLWANTIGTEWPIHPATVHGAVAIAIALLTPWKSITIRRGLSQAPPSRWNSLALLGLILVTLTTGLLHSADVTTRIGPLTLMQIHIGSASIALVLIVIHYFAHRVPIRSQDLNRRAALSSLGLAGAAAATWFLWEGVLDATGAEGGDRRFTGSHERGSFQPAAMPVTSWFNDSVQRIDPAAWSVQVGADTYDLDSLATVPRDTFDAVLDCTSAWYSEQRWTGVRLDRLITTDKRSIDVVSASGYSRRFPTRDLNRLWLVTDMGDGPLSAGHGFPARIVAPDYRGFWWVKWVVAIEPTDVPSWAQLPFPVT